MRNLTVCRNKYTMSTLYMSKLLKGSIFLLFFLSISVALLAQSAGDYRSNAATMNWGTAASWQKYDGTSWSASTDYPGQNACSSCTVTIQNGHTVTLNISPANSIGNLVIGGGTNGTLTLGTYTLTVSGNLTVNSGATFNLATGTFAVNGNTTTSGTVSDASNTGVNTFGGPVTKNAGTWTSTSVTSASNMIFGAGITNNVGAFSLGAATIADNQTIYGKVNISISNGLSVQGNGDLNIAGTTTAGVSFAGTSINYTVRNLNLTGLLTVSTTGNFTVNGVTSITGTGAFTDNNNTGITTFVGAVTHNSTGAWTSTLVTTPANMVFTAGFTNTAGTFSAGAATIGDNQLLTGTVNMSFVNGVVVQGNGDLNISGTATTGVTFGGTAVNYSVRNLNLTGRLAVTTTGNLTVSGTTSITGAGAFIDNNNTGITTFIGAVTHNSTGAWTSTSVTTAANMVFTAGFTNTSGTFSAGAATIGNGQVLTGDIVMVFNSGLTVSGLGNLTVAGIGGVRFGGTAATYTIPGNLTITGTLLVSTTGNLTVSGATSIIGSGAFTDNNNTGVTTFVGLVTHNSTGAWTSTSVSTASQMVFSSGFNNIAGVFNAGAATVGNNQTLTGTVNMSFNKGLVVSGNGDITIAGTATTGVTLAGTLINYSVRNLTVSGQLLVSTTGDFSVSGTTTITGSSAFIDNNGTGTTTFTGLVTVGAAATFTATSITTVGRLNFAGGITQNNTTALAFNVGALRTTATQSWTGSGDIRTTGVIDVNVGALTNNITGTVIVGGTLTGTAFVQGVNANLALVSTTPLSVTTLTATAAGNTVDYRSAGSASLRGQSYYHLIVSGSGTKTISAADVTILGNLTISAGILSNTTNNRNIAISGNWINNVGSTGFAAGTGTVTFNGTSQQVLGGTGSTTFKNLTVNNAAGINQTISSTITGVLTFTSGIVSTGNTSVSISSTGSVTRTSGHINGNLQKYVATGSNVSRTFEVGDATNYTPATLVFASVTTAGNITIKTTSTDHPSIPSSALNGSLSVNRYWALSNSGTVFTNYSATFNFLSTDKDASLNTSNIVVGNYNGSWTYPTVGTKTTTSTQTTGLTSFGDFVLAEFASCSTPTLVINNPAAVCKPSTVNLTSSAITSGSTSGLTYTYWTDAAASIALASPSAVSLSGVYYIKGTLPAGCYDIEPVTVAINSPTGVISGSTMICNGSSAILSIAVTGYGPWSGTLSDGTTFSGSTSPISVVVSPTSTTTYTISTLVDANCTAQSADKTGSALVTASPLPTTANAGVDQSPCGATTVLDANTPIVGTGLWSIVSGTGGSFGNLSSPTSTFTGVVGNVYVLRWTISNSPCNVSTDDVTISFAGGTWLGTVSSDWNNGANWCGATVPTGVVDIALPVGLSHYPVVTGNVAVGDIVINAGASLTVSASGNLNIIGNYSNSGTLTNNGTITLKGSSNQVFPGANATVTAMNNLEIDNADGVTIDKSFTIYGTFTPTNGLINLTNSVITLRSDASSTAAVGVVGAEFDYSGGGKFVVENYISARRAWRMMTSPLKYTNTIREAWQNGGVYTPGKGTFITQPTAANGLDGGAAASMKAFNISTQALVNVSNTLAPISANADSSANIGYFVFLRGDRNPNNLGVGAANTTTLSSAGQLLTGNQTFAGSSLTGKYALIGNPYAAPVDFDKVNRVNLVKRFYAWDPTLNSLGGYVMLDDLDGDGVFSSSVSGSSQTKFLQSGQAVLVQTASDGPSSITFTEESKSTTSLSGRPTGVNRPASIRTKLFAVANDVETLVDGTIAEFNDAFSNEVSLEDAPKMTNTNENIGFFRSSKVLAAERRSLPTVADTMYYKLTKTTVRNYRLEIAADDVDQNVSSGYLFDAYLNTSTPIDLNGTTTVDFAVTNDVASASADRFRIAFRQETVLPVRFQSVKAVKSNNGILLDWKVSDETGVTKYIVEESADGRLFKESFTVSSIGRHAYNWFDASVGQNNFYRIKSISASGEVKYSEVVKLIFANIGSGITVYPNPIKNNTMHLQFSNQPLGNYTINLLNAKGQAVFSADVEVNSSVATQTLLVPSVLAKGNYIVQISSAQNKTTTQKIIVE